MVETNQQLAENLSGNPHVLDTVNELLLLEAVDRSFMSPNECFETHYDQLALIRRLERNALVCSYTAHVALLFLEVAPGRQVDS